MQWIPDPTVYNNTPWSILAYVSDNNFVYLVTFQGEVHNTRGSFGILHSGQRH